jgi:DNA-directed RNA polymerase specialized sigma24 family protein
MAKKSEDELLVEQFSRGDESAFERIVERYSAEVAALANRLLGAKYFLREIKIGTHMYLLWVPI